MVIMFIKKWLLYYFVVEPRLLHTYNSSFGCKALNSKMFYIDRTKHSTIVTNTHDRRKKNDDNYTVIKCKHLQ